MLLSLVLYALNGQAQGTLVESGNGNWEYFVLNDPPHPGPWPFGDYVIPGGVTGWNSSMTAPGGPWLTNYVNTGGTPDRMWADETNGQVHGVLFRTIVNVANADGAFSFDLLPNNECQVFINGVQVGGTYNWTAGLQTICVPPGVMQNGNNLIAIQTTEWLDDNSTLQFLLRQDFVVEAEIIHTCTNTGSIDLTVNGPGPFTYQWTSPNLGSVVTTQDLSNLTPGLYLVVITDSRGCSFRRLYRVRDLSVAGNPFNQDYFMGGVYQSEGWVSTTVETCEGFLKVGNWAYNDMQDAWRIMLTWFDANGDVLMTKNYQGPEISPSIYATAMVLADDGEHVIITGRGNVGLLAMKVRISDGAVIWSSNYDSYIGLDICAIGNDRYALVGKFSTYLSILAIDGSGAVLWHRHYSGIPEQIYPHSMCFQSNGQTITVAGVVNKIFNVDCSPDDNAFFTFAVDLNGGIVNNFKIFDYYCAASGIDVNATPDGGYVLTNFGQLKADAYMHANLLKLDASFNIDWNRIFTRADYGLIGAAVQVTPDGYALGITSIFQGTNTTAGWIQTDQQGHFVSAVDYGTSFVVDYATTAYMIKLRDNGFLINGETYTDWANTRDGYHLIRIRKDGSTEQCYERVVLKEENIQPGEFYATLSPTVVGNPQAVSISSMDHETQLLDCYGRSRTEKSTSTEEVVQNTFRIYPNPGNGSLSIRFTRSVAAVNLVVYDASGKAVYSGKAIPSGQELQLDIHELPQGLYTVRVVYPDGSQQQQRYMKY